MSDAPRARRTTQALSEFAVIVVGVLVALGVDNWNEDRAERAMERSYLEALADDLRGDSVLVVDVYLPALAQKDSALRRLAPIVRGEEPFPADTLDFLRLASLGGRLGNGPALTANPTYSELTSTGALRLIESSVLRARLVAHYSAVQSTSRRIEGRLSGYPMIIHEYYPAELRGLQSDDDAIAFGLRRAVEGIRSERFVRIMNQELNFLYFVRPRMERHLEVTTELIALVDEELAR